MESSLPILLQQARSPQAYSDDPLFQSAVERFLSPAPTQSSHKRPNRGSSSAPRAAQPVLSNEDAWAALSRGSKVANGEKAAVQAPGGAWDQERSTLLAQIAALKINLSTSAKTNQALQREVQGARPEPSGSASQPLTLINGSDPATRRRRVVELASAEQRRLVEVRAARRSAVKTVKSEQQHTVRLRRHLAAAERTNEVELHLLASELEDAETLVTSLATNTEYRLAHSCLENEAELELAEQLHLMQVRAAEGQLKEAREVR